VITHLGETDGVEKLFYELASESRLSILLELQKKQLHMQEMARKLDLSDTEAFRQLQKLSDASLVHKQTDGSYAITQYGKLVLQFSRSFDFAFKFKDCLLTRDIWRIPEQFIDRLGALRDVSLGVDTIEMVNNSEKLVSRAERYLWIIGDKPMNWIDARITDRVQRGGFEVRLLFDENHRHYYEDKPEAKGVFEKKVIASIPAIMLISEERAAVNLLSVDGRADNAVFYGDKPVFLQWASDLFMFYWEQGKRCFPR
jgi:predicted transcriptional regulator